MTTTGSRIALKYTIKKIFKRPGDRSFMEPGFLIIGGQKCGTTSLYNYLIQHPNVIAASKKEIHFFDCNYDKGFRWYKRHFSSTNVLRERPDVITGEATPYYIFHPSSPARVKKTLPNVKLIAMLRDPVERAYSHYKYHVKLKAEKLSFDEVIKTEPARLAGELGKMMRDKTYQSFNYQMFSYMARGIYVNQLRRWLKYFPKEQFHILQSEAFFRDPVGSFRKVLQFLGLPEYELAFYQKFNTGRYESMPQNMREYLTEYFRPFNKSLYEFLEVDFGWQR